MPHKGYKQTDIHKRNISIAHKGQYAREKHSNWKGGWYINNGYVYIRKPEHPRAWSGYVFEHILVAEKMLGRPIKKEERIHHINFNKTDNQEKNLFVYQNRSEHGKVRNSLFKSVPYLIEKGYLKFDKEKGEYYY